MLMFMLSFLKGVRKRLDFYRSRFFRQSNEHKQKYRLTKWNIICWPKDQGGLGVEVLDISNKCLLSKWLFKLLHEGVWQELLHNKYLQTKTLSPPFWKGLMQVKDDFFSFSKGSFVLGNSWALVFGRFMAWWHASILTVSIFIWYCAAKDVYVAHFLSEVQLNIGFRLNSGTKWTAWLHLVLQTFLMSHILLDVSWPPQVSFCLIYACGHVEWTQ